MGLTDKLKAVKDEGVDALGAKPGIPGQSSVTNLKQKLMALMNGSDNPFMARLGSNLKDEWTDQASMFQGMFGKKEAEATREEAITVEKAIAYNKAFINKCAEHNIDPELVFQFGQQQ